MTFASLSVRAGVAWVVVASGLATGARLAWGEEPATWDAAKAGRYVDERCAAWYRYGRAVRGTGETKTSCVCCHTIVSGALARPVLRKRTGRTERAEWEETLRAQVRLRVARWNDLDTPAFGLQYDFEEQKQRESRGTEAVLNALLLAADDRASGAATPGEPTRQAFANLWRTQVAEGPERGSWEWLDFGLEPWESGRARYHGAVLAAVAVGTAPGYYRAGADPAVDAKVALLRGYLKDRFAQQSLFNKVWALWASTALEGVLTAEQRTALIADLFARQREDGGWNLASLGGYVRSDGTAQPTGSDGYATGLVLHVVQTAGIGKDDARVAKGRAWLVRNQSADGSWPAASPNKERDPATFVGKFLSDAATGFAVLALSH